MHLSIWTLIRTFLFMIFGVLLPGYLFARQTARMDQTAELYAFCLFFGISISIIAYFCDAFIGNPLLDRTIFSFCLGPALSIPSCFLLANDIYGHRLEKSTLIPDSILRNIVVVALIISFFSMALKSGISARIVGVSTTYHDVLWNIGNLAALDHGWPADNLQYFGKYLNSNIFAIIFRVVAGRCIGSTAADTFLVFSCFFYAPLLVFSLFSLGLFYMKDNRKRAALFVICFLFVGVFSRAILFFYNINWAHDVAYASYIQTGVDSILTVPNGIDLAVPGISLMALLILKYYRERQINLAYCVALFIAATVTTGAKYVFVLCVIGALVGTILFRIAQGKGLNGLKPVMFTLGLIIVGFILSYFGVVRGGEIYLPATNCKAEFMTEEETGYEEAKEEYLSYLDDKDFRYLIISSKGQKRSPIVRQTTSGVYYVSGTSLLCEEVKENKALDIIRSSSIDTTGLIGGCGGRYYPSELDSFSSIDNSLGFIRFREKNASVAKGTRVLFYGYEPKFDTISSNNRVVWFYFSPGSDGKEYLYSDSYSSLSINAAAKSTEMYKWIVSGAPLTNKVSCIYLILFIPVYFFISRPLTCVPYLLWTGRKLKNFKTINFEDMLVCGIAVCGLIAFFLLSIQGFSQVYFYLTGLIFVDLIAVTWLCDHYHRLTKPVKVLFIILGLTGLFSNVAFYGYDVGRGVMRLVHAYSGKYSEIMPRPDHMTGYECEAMDWLRNNSSPEDIISLNRHHQSPDKKRWVHPQPNDYDCRYYYYSAYCERQTFLGAWAYVSRTPEMQQMLEERLEVNDALFDPFCKNKKEIMEKHGISFLVVSHYVGTGSQMKDPDLKCVFFNRDIEIYVLRNSEKGEKLKEVSPIDFHELMLL